MKRAMLFAALAVMLVFVSVQSYALEGGEYTTPDAWSQHFSFGGVKYNTGGMSIGSGSLDATLTSRTGYRTFKDDDLFEEFIYLRMKADDFKVANGVIRANVFGRYGVASEDFKAGEFNPTKNGFYVERKNDSGSFRLYSASIEVDKVIPFTNLRLGRFYMNHLTTRLIDGADVQANLKDDMVNVYAFYGMPVSFYVGNPRTTAYGGGFGVQPIDFLKLRAEYTMFSYDKDSSTWLADFMSNASYTGAKTLKYNEKDTSLFKARVDANVLDLAKVYVDYAYVDPASIIELGFLSDLPTRTSLFGSAVFYTDYIDERANTFLNAFSNTLGQEGKNTLLTGQIAQGVTDWLVLTVGGKGKIISGDVAYAHRDFANVYGSVDLNGLFDPNLYISINGGYWFAPGDGKFKEESTFQVGGQASYAINKIDIWAGTSFEMFSYYATDIALQTKPTYERRKQYEQNARSFYLGGQYTMDQLGPLNQAVVGLDLSANSSDVYNKLNDKLKDEWDMRVELNLNVVL